MTDSNTLPLIAASRVDHVFPVLTPAQIARVAASGRTRRVEAGEVLIDVGHEVDRSFIVITGRIEIVRPDGEVVVVHRAGQFTGEVSLLSGRPSLLRTRVGESGEVIEVDRADLMAFVQTDAELSEILMRAFILRRVELIAQRLRRRRARRIESFAGDAAHQGVPDAQRPSVSRTSISTTSATSRSCSIASTSSVADVPVLICRGDGRPAQPHQSRDRRLSRLQRRDRPDRTCATS